MTYHLRFTSGPTLTFESGGIEIAGSVAAETSTWWAPNGSVSFKQTVRLMLDTSSQTVTPLRFDDPQVNQSWFIPHQTVVNTVKSQIDNALIANTPAVRRVFADGKTTLLKGLSSFDPFASVTYTGIDITPDGVIVRGEIGSLPRRPPVVNIAETENSSAFTAFESWIPAGRIDRFIWSWIEYTRFSLWSGVEKSFTDEHRFIFPKPAAATQLEPDLPSDRRHADIAGRPEHRSCSRNDMQRGRVRVRHRRSVVVGADHSSGLAAQCA